MNRRCQILLLASLLLASGLTVAATESDPGVPENLADAPSLPRDAILRYAETDLEHWAYYRIKESAEGVVVDHHDPTREGPDHWRLVSVDGRLPTTEEITEYNEDRADHSESSDEKARGEDITAVLAPGSIRFAGAEGQAQRFTYGLRSPDGKRKRTFGALTGDLTVRPGALEPYVETVRVWTTKTIRPTFGLRIDEAMLTFDFVEWEGTVLPAAGDVRFNGAFLLVKSLEEDFRFTLGGFHRVQEESLEPAETDPAPAP